MKHNALIPSLVVAAMGLFAVVAITILDADSLSKCEALYSTDQCIYTLK